MTDQEKLAVEAEKVAVEKRVTAAVRYLEPDSKPKIQSTALWVYGVTVVTSGILFLSAKLGLGLSQEIAAQGAGFLLAAAVGIFGWIRRIRKPVEVPIAGSEAAKTGN